MEVCIKKVDKQLMFATIGENISDILHAISATALKEVQITQNIFALCDIEAFDKKQDINLISIEEVSDDSFEPVELLRGTIVFVCKNKSGEYISLSEEDCKYLNINIVDNSIYSRRYQRFYDSIEISWR